MNKLFGILLIVLLMASSLFGMKIPNSSTDKWVYFIAVDATDMKTLETGFSSFTVYYSINAAGASGTAMTTPTINETDSTNMAGAYELLIDEADMTTIDTAGDDNEELLLYITHAGMRPVIRAIEIYRPKITEGQTVTVSGGNANADTKLIEGSDATTYFETRTLATADYFIASSDPVEIRDSGGVVGANTEDLVNAIWDEPRGAHTIGNTFGGDALDNDTWTDTRAGYLNELAAANLPTDVAAIPTAAEVVNEWESQSQTDPTGFHVNLYEVNGNATPVGNWESTFDGSGYTNDVAPATQSQLDQIALTGSAVSTPAKDSPNGFTIVWGEAEANTEDSTHAADDVYHDIEAQNDTGTEKIDVYYEFAIGGDGIPTTASWEGLLDKGGGAAKNITVQAYNWGGTAWDQIGSITSSNNDISETFTMFTSHVGTGANIGVVRIRFVTGSVSFTATTKLRTDQIFVSYAIVVRTVGYDMGAVWINTNASNTNTESFVDGTADNPVSTLVAATTIASNLGLKHFRIIAGSSITLAQAYSSYTFAGDNWTLALDSQVINNTLIIGADVTGICTGTSPHFFDCDFGSATLPGSTLRRCSLGGTITFNDVDDYFFDQCYSAIAGTATPNIDFGAAIGSTNLSMRHYSGGIEIENLGGTGTDSMSLEGWGQLIINSSSDAGTIAIRGSFTITDNAPGGFSGTLSEDARYDTGQVNAEVDSALADYDGPTDTEMIARTLATADYFLFGSDTVSLSAATETQIDNIESDTNELQVDWVNGGRLDLILDAVKAYWDSLTITGGLLEVVHGNI